MTDQLPRDTREKLNYHIFQALAQICRSGAQKPAFLGVLTHKSWAWVGVVNFKRRPLDWEGSNELGSLGKQTKT